MGAWLRILSLSAAAAIVLISPCHARARPPPPPTKGDGPQNKGEPPRQEELENPMNEEWMNVEYKKYLDEVVAVLEKDENIKKQFVNVSEEDIKSGKIADRINFPVDIRDKLSEIKRREIERLRKGIEKLVEAKRFDEIKVPEHLDHANMDTFDTEDLKKLIKKTNNDFEELDKQRKKEFKEYEMKKKLEEKDKLGKLDDAARAKMVEEIKQAAEKATKHGKVHHPGSEAQLKEVWEDVDHLDPDNFDMRTFFNLHDINGDGYLDMYELEALFQKELDKVYNPEDPNFDARERYEEESRMREHVMREVDRNRDGLITYEEFAAEEQDVDFKQDPEWKPIKEDGDPEYTDEELAEFEKQWRAEMEAYARQYGGVPPGMGGGMGGPMGQGQGHPMGQGQGQMPMGQGQGHPMGQGQGQMPMQGQMPQQYPQGQGHVPPMQGQMPQQYPQGQPHPGMQGQAIPQGQMPQQGQPQVQQAGQGKVPQQQQIQQNSVH